MEKDLQELYDEKIHLLQQIEEEINNLAGSQEESNKCLEKVYRVILVQKQIDRSEEII